MRRHNFFTLTMPERVALAGAAALLALQAVPGAGPALQYDSARLVAEPWRLFSAHLVHLNWSHALTNAAAWWLVVRVFAPELSPTRQGWIMVTAALAIGATLWIAMPQLASYRGFSGVLHALYFTGAVAWWLTAVRSSQSRTLRGLWLPAVLLAAGVLKVVLEQPWDRSTPYADWLGGFVVPQAHLAGATVGTLFGVAFAARSAPAQGR